MEELFTSVSTYGYIIIFWYSLGGGFLGLVVASVLAYAGTLSFPLVLLVALLGNFLGDIMLFYLSRYQKKDILPYFKKHKRKLALSKLIMKKHGAKAIFIQKYIYGVKTIIPLAMGLTKYSFKKFIFFNIFASVLFVLSIGNLSYFSGEVLLNVYEYVTDNKILIPIIILFIFGSFWFYFDYYTKKK